jgi:hypothetical protein
MKLSASTALVAYSVALSTVLAGVAVTRASSGPTTVSMDTIDVHRINLREKDGTLRMVIANSDEMPGLYLKGKEYPHPARRGAGILFFNDEGTENGGFGFGGARGADGKVDSGGQIAFDQYEQDQVIDIFQSEHAGHRAAGLQVNDRPSESMDIPLLTRIEGMPDGPEKQAEIKRLMAAGVGGHNRLFAGKAEGDSIVALKDGQGHARLTMKVGADGTATIQFLDETGKVTRSIAP